MQVIWPKGTVSEWQHESDKKQNPDRHWPTKESYSHEEMTGMCSFCADFYGWDKIFTYSNPLRRWFKTGKKMTYKALQEEKE